ncbi:MAG: hypothetical protein PWP31_96 [Clostridia bacterium]|nr:hypothetical protein [Clostridia bacterium]
MESLLQPINPEKYQPVREEAYYALREAILTGALEPGTRLVERKVAKQLGVSRTPVREAIRRLEIEGLVEHLPKRGVVVSWMSDKEAGEVYNIRAVLEGLAARLAAKNIKPTQQVKLMDLVNDMEEAYKENDSCQLQRLHIKFNEIIYEAANSSRLHHLINNLVDYIVGFTKVSYNVPGRVEEDIKEHRELAEAIVNRDIDKAEKMARKHIENASNAYFEGLKNK